MRMTGIRMSTQGRSREACLAQAHALSSGASVVGVVRSFFLEVVLV